MKEPSEKDIKKEKQSELDKIAETNAKCVAGYQVIRNTVFNNISDGDLTKMNKYIKAEYGKVYTGLKGMIIDALNDAKDKNVELVEKLLDESLPPARHYKVLPKTAPFKYTNRVFTEKSVSVRSQKAADAITKIIADGRNEGLAIPDIQKKIDIVMGFRDAQGRITDKSKKLIESGRFTHRNGSIYETYRIARTEVMRMNAFAKYAQFDELKQKYPNARLKLIATIDGRERTQSREMNGQISNAKGEFLYPDAKYYRLGTAPAQWSINDRETCTIVFLTDKEAKENREELREEKQEFERDINVLSKRDDFETETSINTLTNTKIDITKTYTGANNFVNSAIDKAYKDKTTNEILANIHKLPEVEVIKNSKNEAFTPALGSTKAKLKAGSEKAFYHEFGHSLDYAVAKKLDPNNSRFNWLSNELTDINQEIIKKLDYKIPQELEDKFTSINNQVKDIFRNKYVDKVSTEVKDNIKKKYKNFFSLPQQLQNSIANDEYEKITTKYYKKAISETPQYVEWSCLSDVYDALTVGKASKYQSMLGTHGQYYYQDLGTGIKIGNSHPINTEIFANYFEMRMGNYTEQLNFLKKHEPELYNKLDMVYNKVAKELKNAK